MDALYAWTRDLGGTSSGCNGKTAPQAGCTTAQGPVVPGLHVSGPGMPASRLLGRGNGWVIAAMAQVLQIAAARRDTRTRATYAGMLQAMAAELVPLQGSDGSGARACWIAALYPQPETSGTAFIAHALAYGIKAGLLDAATYLPAVAKAWKGLTDVGATRRLPHRLPADGPARRTPATALAPHPRRPPPAPSTPIPHHSASVHSCWRAARSRPA